MLRTNLSTRPFYNEKGVHTALMVTALIVVAFTVFNLTQIVLLTRRYSALRTETAAADARTQELRAQAAQMRQAIDTKQLDSISNAAREANDIINQRLFSWTDLLNRFDDTTMPADVRITSLRPRVERDGTVTVSMTLSARSVDDIEEFMTNLEKTTAFSDVFPLQDERGEGGLVQATIEGKYAAAP
jgi:hypothetical protein